MKNFKKYIIVIAALFTVIFPLGSLAVSYMNEQGQEITSTVGCNLATSPKLGDLFSYATCIISSSVIPLIFALALAMFVWGVVQYVINSSEEAKREKGRQFMIWGIIALAVMVCIWGLVHILGSTFGIENVIPQVKTQ